MSSFSVVIPAWNEGDHIRQVLTAVQGNYSDEFDVEILLVDAGSTDDTVSIAKEMGARVLETSSGSVKTIAGQRNLGAKCSTGRFLAFLDADMLVPPDWLRQSYELFNSGFSGLMGVVDRPPEDAHWVGDVWGQRVLRGSNSVEVDFLPSRNMLVERAVFDQVCGFDETLLTTEDKDFSFRVRQAGYSVIRIDSIEAVHLGYERGLGEFVRKEFWRQSSALSFAKKQGYSFRSLRNPLMGLGHVAVGCVGLISLISGAQLVAALLCFFWLLPSFLICWKGKAVDSRSDYFLKLFLLTLIRWNVAGSSLVVQVVKRTRLVRYSKVG